MSRQFNTPDITPTHHITQSASVVYGRALEEQRKALELLAEIEAREKALKKAEEDQEALIRQLLTQNGELAAENAHLKQVRNMYIEKELQMKEKIESLMEARQK